MVHHLILIIKKNILELGEGPIEGINGSFATVEQK